MCEKEGEGLEVMRCGLKTFFYLLRMKKNFKKTDPRFGFKTEVKVLLVFLKVKVRYVVFFVFFVCFFFN